MMASRAANEYGFVNARIRGMKSRFLSVGTYESLLQSKSYEDFIKIISSTYYGQVISRESSTSRPTPEDLALILSRDFAEVSTNLSRSITGKVQAFTKTYLEMFLADSIKSIIRGVHVGLDRDEILRFAVPLNPTQADQFSMLVDAGSVGKLIDLIPYRDMKVALLTKLPKYEEFDSTAPLDVALEEWHLKKVLNALIDFSKEDQNRVLDFLVTRVVLRNVLTMLRALALQMDAKAVEQSLVRFALTREITKSLKTASSWREVFSKLDTTRYSHLSGRLARLYEEHDDLSEVELAIEDYIAQRVKLQLTAFPFHLGTLTGFFNLKFYEIRNIRSIAVGIERKESADVIRRMITIW